MPRVRYESDEKITAQMDAMQMQLTKQLYPFQNAFWKERGKEDVETAWTVHWG